VFDPNADPEGGGRSDAKRERGADSDRQCPWCGETNLGKHKKMPSPLGPGILVYVIFPLAVMLWFGTPTYNVCPKCGGRWQRGVRIEPAAEKPAEQPRAGMYAKQVPAAAVVRRKARLGPEQPNLEAQGVNEVELKVALGSCRTCRQAGGRYDVRDVPPIPVPGCTCEAGCKCEVVPADVS
jgi:hypothetical protein